jgi:hypothetical protein
MQVSQMLELLNIFLKFLITEKKRNGARESLANQNYKLSQK